jgi:hypothetical protein
MTDLSNGSSGAPSQVSSANGGEIDDSGSAGNQKDVVKYETYQRTVGQYKKASEENAELRKRLQDLEKAEKARVEQDLLEQNKYKDLLDLREKEAQAAKAELEELKHARIEARKLDAVLKHIQGHVSSEYWVLIDTNKVIINPNTNEIDEASVDLVAKEFVKRHSRLIDFPNSNNARMDNKGAIPNGSGKLTRDEWIKLGATERAKRAKEVADMPDWMVGNNGATYRGKV